MIRINLGKPKSFNPENVDYLQYNNMMIKDSIEKTIKETIDNIEWSINFSCKDFEPELVYHDVFVDNPACEAKYKLIYKLNNGESFHIGIRELGDTFTFNIEIKSRKLIEYKLVENNKVNIYPSDYKYMLDKFKETYDIIFGLL